MRQQLEQLQTSDQPLTEDALNEIGQAMESIGQNGSGIAHASEPSTDAVESSQDDGSRRPSSVLNETQSEPILRATADDDAEPEQDEVSKLCSLHRLLYLTATPAATACTVMRNSLLRGRYSKCAFNAEISAGLAAWFIYCRCLCRERYSKWALVSEITVNFDAWTAYCRY